MRPNLDSDEIRRNTSYTHGGQTGNIDASEESRNARSWLVEITQPFESRIGDWDTRFLGIYCGVREVGGLAKVCTG